MQTVTKKEVQFMLALDRVVSIDDKEIDSVENLDDKVEYTVIFYDPTIQIIELESLRSVSK